MRALLFAMVLLLPGSGQAETVLELFTSQSCSSCPSAEALLGEVADQPGVVALALHVDYWNRLGWRDPYSSNDFTLRQRRYAAAFGDDSVYTPELVVNGTKAVVGSDRSAVWAAITAERREPGVPMRLHATAGGLVIEADGGSGSATLWVAGFDPERVTAVGGGENGGRRLVERNIVRSLRPAGAWRGDAASWRIPVPEGERAAAFLQRSDGRIIGAALLH